MNPQPLFFGTKIRLTAPDPDTDAEVEAQWTHDPTYARALGQDAVRPLAPFQVKKKYENEAKEVKERGLFVFHLRPLAEERLLGFARFFWIEWPHGVARVQLAIGAPADRGQGFGTEALQLVLRYGFDELNLYRLAAFLPGDNPGALRFAERAGFQVEGRRREALYRDGQRVDLVLLGLLRDEWRKAREQATAGELVNRK